MVYIYVLELENNKWYVGKTTNPEFRLESHFNSNGSAWTNKFKPIKLHQLIPDCDDYDEDKYTMMYMDKYGINNVRGGTYVQIQLADSVIENLIKISRCANDKCFICGNSGHFAVNCSGVEDDSIDLSEYLSNFESIEQIDNEIEEICSENILFIEIKRYANLHHIINPLFKSENSQILLVNNVSVFDKIKDSFRTIYENKKKNIECSNIIDQDDIKVINKMLRIINIIKEIKKTIEKEKKNIYKCYELSNINCFDSLINKYIFNQTNFINMSQVDYKNKMKELDNDLNIIKIFYLDSVVFIKSNQKLLSNYPENYEKIMQTKIIELNKKKMDLI
jgi:hypothetical protein